MIFRCQAVAAEVDIAVAVGIAIYVTIPFKSGRGNVHVIDWGEIFNSQ